MRKHRGFSFRFRYGYIYIFNVIDRKKNKDKLLNTLDGRFNV